MNEDISDVMAAHCDTYLVNKHDDRHKVYAISVIGQRTVIIFDVTIVLVIKEYGFFIECPVCRGAGVDLEGYICWKCKGHGQIKYEDVTQN